MPLRWLPHLYVIGRPRFYPTPFPRDGQSDRIKSPTSEGRHDDENQETQPGLNRSEEVYLIQEAEQKCSGSSGAGTACRRPSWGASSPDRRGFAIKDTTSGKILMCHARGAPTSVIIKQVLSHFAGRPRSPGQALAERVRPAITRPRRSTVGLFSRSPGLKSRIAPGASPGGGDQRISQVVKYHDVSWSQRALHRQRSVDPERRFGGPPIRQRGAVPSLKPCRSRGRRRAARRKGPSTTTFGSAARTA